MGDFRVKNDDFSNEFKNGQKWAEEKMTKKTIKCFTKYCYKRVKIPAKSPYCTGCETRNQDLWAIANKK